MSADSALFRSVQHYHLSQPWTLEGLFLLTHGILQALDLTSYVASGTKRKQGHCVKCNLIWFKGTVSDEKIFLKKSLICIAWRARHINDASRVLTITQNRVMNFV